MAASKRQTPEEKRMKWQSATSNRMNLILNSMKKMELSVTPRGYKPTPGEVALVVDALNRGLDRVSSALQGLADEPEGEFSFDVPDEE